MNGLAKVLVFGVCLAFAIAAGIETVGTEGWAADLRARCVAQGGQVIEMVSRVQVGCLLPPGVPSLAESP